MSQELPLLRKYAGFMMERFPPAGALLYAAALFYAPYLAASLFPEATAVDWPRSLAGLGVVFLLLLHLRVFDEHKDYERDRLAYPERMLSRGAITLADLKRLGALALLLEAGAALWLGWAPLVLWLLALGWSVLMFYEFFVPRFLQRWQSLYLLTHQLLVPMVALFALGLRLSSGSLAEPTLALVLLGSMGSTVSYEVGRKTWSPDREHDQADSYSKVWGRAGAVAAGQAAALISSFAWTWLIWQQQLGWIHLAILGGLHLLFLAAQIAFLLRPERGRSKLVEILAALYMLGALANFAVACW